MAVHNMEEAIFFPRYLPLVLERLPDAWRALFGPMTLGQVWAALLGVTLIPFRSPKQARWALLPSAFLSLGPVLSGLLLLTERL